MGTRFDLVIRNGAIVDGTGAAPRAGDVAVSRGRIAAVGRFEGSGAEEIDAKGKLVTPGFVDIHTHYDGQAVWDSHMAPSSWHGVTTAVMGNCGVGFAPCKPADREKLVELMEGVEDIPGPVMHEGLKWEWESFAEYLGALERRKRDIDLCALLPHAAVRVYVMGERAIRHENANRGRHRRRCARSPPMRCAPARSASRPRAAISHKSLTGDTRRRCARQEDGADRHRHGPARTPAPASSRSCRTGTSPTPKAEFAMLRRVVEKSRPALRVHADAAPRERALRRVARAARLRRRRDHGRPCRSGRCCRRARSACCSAWRAARTRSPARRTYKSIAQLPLAERVQAHADPAVARQDPVRGSDRGLAPSR